MRAIGTLAFYASAALAAAATVTLPAADALAQVVAPLPREQSLPEGPTDRSGMPMEGWVVLRYTILADGTTADVHAIDRMPPQLDVKEAVAAAGTWTFAPATDGGAPIEWHNNEIALMFDVDSVPLEPSPPFVNAYREVDALIGSEDFKKALKSNESMLSTVTSRIGEIGVAEVQNASINLSLGDLHAAYDAIKHATDPRVPVLSDEDLRVALQYRNVIELQLGDMVAALDTFERRKALGPVADSDPMASRAAAIAEALQGEAAIAIKAKVLEDSWRHVPSRRTFAISDVDGDIKGIRVECNRRSADLEFTAETEWTLPASWGDCTLMVQGRRDTEFTFYEFP